jgi:tetraacyldisaccharide 4'-kinase
VAASAEVKALPALPPRPRWARAVEASWWQPPSWLSCLLWPLAVIHRLLWTLRAAAYRKGLLRSHALPVPVVVVGNLVAGGAGKTPTTLALVEMLRGLGWTPGVVSRGWGRADDTVVVEVRSDARAADVGDEPLLLRLRTGAPVVVGADRVAAAQALLQRHPQVDVVLSDDGLQHLRLQRDVEVVVVDSRGLGNGLMLPAGPLREPPSAERAASDWLVVYNAGQAPLPWPGTLARRGLGGVVALEAWWQGAEADLEALHALRGRRVLAAAGLAAPQRFFDMLHEQGLQVEPLPLPDHHDFAALPWPAGTREVLVTEKDAVKLDPARCTGVQVWVVRLDFALDDSFARLLASRLALARSSRSHR